MSLSVCLSLSLFADYAHWSYANQLPVWSLSRVMCWDKVDNVKCSLRARHGRHIYIYKPRFVKSITTRCRWWWHTICTCMTFVAISEFNFLANCFLSFVSSSYTHRYTVPSRHDLEWRWRWSPVRGTHTRTYIVTCTHTTHTRIVTKIHIYLHMKHYLQFLELLRMPSFLLLQSLILLQNPYVDICIIIAKARRICVSTCLYEPQLARCVKITFCMHSLTLW